jgi:molybdopterin-guanine dinucleotide biosynthesis protein A
MNFYILAGGRSQRLGRNKALLKINGVTLIETVIAAVPAEKEKIKIVANAPAAYRFLPYQTISDVLPSCGPISGIHAGLVDSSAPHHFFLACDLPFLSRAAIVEIINRYRGQDIFGARTRDGFQPLCAIYSKSCLPAIEAMIQERNYSLHELIERVNSEFIDMTGRADFFNLNTPEDWQILVNHTS